MVSNAQQNATSPSIQEQLAKYQNKQVDPVYSEVSATLNFTPLILADGTKVTTTNGVDYKDAGGNSYFYIGVQGRFNGNMILRQENLLVLVPLILIAR